MAVAAASASKSTPPHVVFVVGDDVGYADIGFFNDKKTITPTMDNLLEQGVFLSDYYTFKICSPSRAAMMTGRYPWAAGFYAMNADTDHCTTNSTALPQLLKPLGYSTHALGKWDVGFMLKNCTPTYRGFDTFLGYYMACEGDYWYHTASGGYPNQPNCTKSGQKVNTFYGDLPTDLSNSSGANIRPAAASLNGTYNTRLLADEAARLVTAHDPSVPFYMYLAFMAVHDGCNSGGGKIKLGKQAPLETVHLYNNTVLDTYKVAGAMYTELDSGIQTVINALEANNMWENTVLIFVSDNGGPLDHCTNSPLRGGKHTFLEGGVRVMSFVSGPLIPAARRGTRWTGMAASADWYATITEGIAGGTLPANTGYRPPDALNVWGAILDGSPGPRTEVVHQVENQWICDVTQGGGGCCSSIRMGEMKLIIGGPGDSRTLEIPQPCVPGPIGYAAPCPQQGFVTGCIFECGAKFDNCEACFGNTSRPTLITPTAEACQQACANDKTCGAFQWIGVGDNSSTSPGSETQHHQCILKCPGAIQPGRTDCSLGHPYGSPGGSFVCGPKHNDSSAPPPPPAPPGPTQQCPVPFGLSGGQLEEGTTHARAGGQSGTITELKCSPWCLFNLTSDIGERNDLGSNQDYQDIAQRMADRLKYHGSTGPMPAYIWPLPEWQLKTNELCKASVASGYVEPLDV